MIRRFLRRLFRPAPIDLTQQRKALERVVAHGPQPKLRRRWSVADERYDPINKPKWWERYGRSA